MRKFKRTRIALSRLGVAARNFGASLKGDLMDEASALASRSPAPASGSSSGASVEKKTPIKPVVFASYATDESLKGSHIYCGGEKLLNNLIVLLRRHGYDAYMVSLDGSRSDWLVEHAPFLSVEEFRKRLGEAPSARCVSSWLPASAYLQHCSQFYFWDQELAASSRSHFPLLANYMAEGRIVRTAGVNRAVQAYHATVFDRPAAVLRQLVDEKYWQPAPERRVRRRVGFLDEGTHGADYVRRISELTKAKGLDLEFFQLSGPEGKIIDQMQQCGVFLALNIGKSPLWGEGGPMTPQEAMACGTVPVCFDMNGPWEIIQQNYNGVITSRIDPDLMAKALVEIYEVPGRLEEMSRRGLEMTKSSHTMEARWSDVVKFLDLPE